MKPVSIDDVMRHAFRTLSGGRCGFISPNWRELLAAGILCCILTAPTLAQSTTKKPVVKKSVDETPAPAAGEVIAQPSATEGDEPAAFFTKSDRLPFAPVMFYSATLSPDDRWVAGGTSDWTKPGQLLLWDTANRKLKFRHQFGLGVRSVAFSPDSNLLAAGTFTNEILIFDISRNSVVAQWKAHNAAVNGVAFSRDGQLLASASLDKSVKVWNVSLPSDPKGGLPLRVKFEGHKDWIFTVAFGHDGKTLYSGGREAKVFVWDIEQNRPLTVWKDLPAAVEFLAVSRKGEAIALGLWNGTVELRNPKDGAVISTLTHLENNQFTITTVAFSKDGNWLASAAYDGTAKLWKYPSGELQTTFNAHTGRAWAATPTNDASRLLTAGSDGNLRMWDTETKKQLFQLPVDGDTTETASDTLDSTWAKDRTTLATSHADLTVRVRDGKTGQSLKVITAPVEIRSLAFSADGQKLAGAGQNRTVYVWDVSGEIGDPVALRGHQAKVTSVVFPPDGRSIFSAAEDGAVQQWDVATAAPGLLLDAGKKEIFCLACADDGRWLAAGGQARTIQLWDLTKLAAKPVTTLRGHQAAVRTLAFAPRQPWLASSSRETSVLLWDLAGFNPGSDPAQHDGIRLRELTGHLQPVNSLAFSPGGNWLATGSADKTIRMWETRTGAGAQVLLGSAICRSLTFNSAMLLSVESDNTLNIWRTRPAVSFPAVEGRYVKLKALSAVQKGDPFASAAEISLFENGVPLSKSNWKLVSVDSEDKGNEGTLAFDNNSNTFWHTQWRIETPVPQPHEIIIDLGKVHRLSGLFVLSRTDDSANGTIKDYEFFVSTDPKKFGPPASQGQLNAAIVK